MSEERKVSKADVDDRITEKDTLQEAAIKLLQQAKKLANGKKQEIDGVDIEIFNKELREAIQGKAATIEGARLLSRTFWQIYVHRFSEQSDATWYRTFLEEANSANDGAGDPLLFLHPCDRDEFCVAMQGAKEKASKKDKLKREDYQFPQLIGYANALVKCEGKNENGNSSNEDLLAEGELVFDAFNWKSSFLTLQEDKFPFKGTDDERIIEKGVGLEPGVPHSIQGDLVAARIISLTINPAYAPRVWREKHVKPNTGKYWLAERGFLGLHLCGECLEDTFYQFQKQRLFEGTDLEEAAKKESNWYVNNYKKPDGSIFNTRALNSEQIEALDRSFAQMEIFPYQTSGPANIPNCFRKYEISALLPSQLVTFYLFKAVLQDRLIDNWSPDNVRFVVRDRESWLKTIAWLYKEEDEMTRKELLDRFKRVALELLAGQRFKITFKNLITIAQKESICGEKSSLYQFAASRWPEIFN